MRREQEPVVGDVCDLGRIHLSPDVPSILAPQGAELGELEFSAAYRAVEVGVVADRHRG